jgi:uncharacterized protein YciI
LEINVKYYSVSPETYRGFGFPGADDIGNMFHVWRDFEKEYVGNRSVEESRELNPELMTFSQWLSKYGHNLNYRVTGKDLRQWSLDHNMLAKQLYIYFSTPNQGVTRVMQNVEPHLQHLFRLEREGLLYASGPFSDANSDADFAGDGMVIIRARNMEHAKEIADADPFHKSGIRSYTIRPWTNNEGVEQMKFTKSTGKTEFF